MVPRLLILTAMAAAGTGALDAAAGRGLFDRPWVAPPASLRAQSGLGPLYQARACAACHQDAGPGRVGEGVVDAGAVVRLGDAAGRADPTYGAAIQAHAAAGVPAEARPVLAWHEAHGLRIAEVRIGALAYGPLARGTHVSLRRAPGLDGVGLIDAVPEADVLAIAARQAREGDGVSGRPAWLPDGKGGRALGRWGWKASEPGLPAQAAAALERDMGISASPARGPWGDCTPRETECRTMAVATQAGTGAEAPASALSLIVAYLRSLEAPQAPSASDPGARVFARAGCAACHAELRTADGVPVKAMTDLLLHDMGPGLSDGMGEAAAVPAEWRTAPLWNLRAELDRGGLLHDGRARSIGEAVAWHGGEAAHARARYAALGAADRAALERFLLGR